MSSKITNNDINKFLVRVYFGEIKKDNLPKNIILLAINRAYLDFCRTLRDFKLEHHHDEIITKSKEYLKDTIVELLSQQERGENFYNEWHKQTCEKLITFFPKTKNYFYYGQAQKWINMTLKYLFTIMRLGLLSEYEYSIKQYYLSFHVPIDNIILDKLKNENADCPKFKTPWSKINNYEKYMDFQKWIREKFSNEIPMDKEFKLWMD